VITLADIEAARARIGHAVEVTRLLSSPALSALAGRELLLKTENLQRTGSFKIRGAVNRVATLPPEARARGVVAASAGNHAQGLAFAAREYGVQATIVMPEQSSITKVGATRALGATIVLHGATYDDAYAHACALQAETGATFVPAFDDDEVIAGQGTIGLEIADQCPEAGVVVFPVGGGGLIAGSAVALKARLPRVRIAGVQAAGAAAAVAARRAGHPVTLDSIATIADGIALKTVGERTYPLIERYVDDLVTVEEEEIAEAILILMERAKLIVEGAGAVPLAALLAGRVPATDGPTVLVLSGGNIDVTFLARIIERGLIRAGRLMRFTVDLPDSPGRLAHLATLVGQVGGNILHVYHDRGSLDLPITWTRIRMDVETRGDTHAAEIVRRLAEAGYTVRRLG
jgi:threonine dehydratase